MATNNPLKAYKAKRDLKSSGEPSAKKTKKHKQPIFVIHKHDASHLHYDLRLEVDGVLKSWAVPKGPSLDPSVKHLAVMVEDHPYDYKDFEGVIPEGEYGAGPVIIWDKGTYKNIKEKDGQLVPMDECIKRGTIEIELDGDKLKGEWALVRFKSNKDWLLIKMKDQYADKQHDILKEDESVVSHKTIKDLKKDADEKSSKPSKRKKKLKK